MKTKTEEVQELVVLTDEQIELLPDTVKENVVFLTENMNQKDLMVLNPIVQELLVITNNVANLKIKPIGEDGKWDKDNIQTFVDAKKEIRSFRAKLKEAGSKLKEPYLAIQKGIVAIEKAVKGVADDAYTEAESIFKEYVKWEEEQKAEKERKKNEALLSKVEEAQAIANEAQMKQKRTDVYNNIKYNLIHRNLVERVSDAILDANQRKLETMKMDIESWTYESTIQGNDITILSQELQAELHALFSQSKTKAVRLLNDKIDELVKNAMQPTPIAETTLVPPPPIPPTVTTHGLGAHLELNDEEFYKYVTESVSNLLNLTIERIKANPKCAPSIYDLRNRLSIF